MRSATWSTSLAVRGPGFRRHRTTRRDQERAAIRHAGTPERGVVGGIGAGEVVEEIAEVDIHHVAERDHMRETDVAVCRPVDQSSHDRAGLGHQGECPRSGGAVCETGIDAQARDLQAETVRPQNAQAMGAGRLQHRLLLHGIEPGRNNDSGARATCSNLAHQSGDGRGRRRDNREFGYCRQFACRANARATFDRSSLGIDQVDPATEATLDKVAGDCQTDRARACTSPDQHNGTRVQQCVEVANGHVDASAVPRPWLLVGPVS